MNLNDYELTDFSGLYISKDAHPTFGKKYIVRFQHEKKKICKSFGLYDKRWNNFKNSI